MLNVVKKGKHRKLAVIGDLNIYSAGEFKQELFEQFDQKISDVEIDLANVSEMDTSGFQIFVQAKRYADEHEFPMRLVNHSVAVIEVLDLYNATSYFGDPVVLHAGKEKKL